MPDCPHCAQPIAPDERVCPSCGFDTLESTASFPAVEAAHALEEGGVEIPVEGPVLIVNKGPQVGEPFFIDRAVLSMGRDPESDVFLNDMTVSRNHAVIRREGERVSIEDAGSLNGTYVNDACIDAAVLHDGDTVQIGTFRMVFVRGVVEGGDQR